MGTLAPEDNYKLTESKLTGGRFKVTVALYVMLILATVVSIVLYSCTRQLWI